MEFRANVMSNNGNASLIADVRWSDLDHKHLVTLPYWLPGDVFTINLILLHVGGQALQDPPCFNNLTVRTHCERETLWFSHIANATLTVKVENSHIPLPTRQKCEPWDNTAGIWRRDMSGKWIWDNPFCERTLPDSDRPPMPLHPDKCVIIGDSTVRAIHWYLREKLEANETCRLYSADTSKDAYTAITNLGTVQRLYHKKVEVAVYNTGLHATCYQNVDEELKLMRPILKDLSSRVDHLVVRSTVALTYVPGLDFLMKKCVYYTEARVSKFNAEMKKICEELGIPFWDVYSMTAASFPFSDANITDGTHFCTKRTLEGNIGYACSEEMRMLFAIFKRFINSS